MLSHTSTGTKYAYQRTPVHHIRIAGFRQSKTNSSAAARLPWRWRIASVAYTRAPAVMSAVASRTSDQSPVMACSSQLMKYEPGGCTSSVCINDTTPRPNRSTRPMLVNSSS